MRIDLKRVVMAMVAAAGVAGLNVAAEADTLYFINFNNEVVNQTPPIGGDINVNRRIDRVTAFTQGSGQVVSRFGDLTNQPLLLDPERPISTNPFADAVAEFRLAIPAQYNRFVMRTDVYVGREAAQPQSFESLRITMRLPELTGIEFGEDGRIDAFHDGEVFNSIRSWDERQRIRVWMDYRKNIQRMRVYIGNTPRAVLNTRVDFDQLNDIRVTYTDEGFETNQVAIDGLVVKGFGLLGPPPVDNSPLLGSAADQFAGDGQPRLGSAAVAMPTPSAAAAGLMALGGLMLRRRRV